jgi:glycosyltransferase involved in cell wall biosynthesis
MQIDSSQLRQQACLTATIVICTRNRPNLLRQCLEGIARLELAPDEVIVVDNTSGDSETEAVVRDFSAAYVVEPVQGLSRARNRGLAESHSEIVAYLDDDATPDAHWLGRMLEPFKDPQVSAVAGKIVTPESQGEARADQPPRFLDNKDPKWFEIVTFGGLGLGSNMALRRKPCIGQRIFDERLGRGAPFQIAEENYAFAFLISRGYAAVYLPNAIVFHPPLKNGVLKLEARNRIAYWMLLFSEFPGRRMDLLRFLFRRMRREPLTWPRDAPDPGAVVSSGWRVLLAASFSGLFLFFRTRKPR